MKAIVTTGNGGYDKLVYKDVQKPIVAAGEVLIQVLAAGVNNTEINTRVGWYENGGWDIATPFPFIQGTDCCGKIVEVAEDLQTHLLGKRVLIRPCMRPDGFGSMRNIWMGSDFDGAFAQYVKAPASEVFVIESNWSDVELGSIPCSYGSAENMLLRAKVSATDHVLIAGASGGVGSAAVQLAKLRGARVTAIVGADKAKHAIAIGADKIIERGTDIAAALGEETIDVVVDNVGGKDFESILKVLRRGGRYVSSGAIGGPVVSLDLRTFYLKDLTLIGCTAWDEPVFGNLVAYIEKNQIEPLVAKTFALRDIAKAQSEFLEKKHFGKFVLVPEH